MRRSACRYTAILCALVAAVVCTYTLVLFSEPEKPWSAQFVKVEHSSNVAHFRKRKVFSDYGFMNFTTSSNQEVIGNLNKCLHSTKLLGYLESLDLVEPVVKNVTALFQLIQRYLPPEKTMLNPSRHCWMVGTTLELRGRVVTGHIGNLPFWGDLEDVEILYSMKHSIRKTVYYTDAHIPLSCLPDVFLAGFPKCGSTFLYDLITSHPMIAKSQHKETRFWTHSIPESTFPIRFADYFINLNSHLHVNYKSNLALSIPQSILTVDGSPTTMFRWPWLGNTDPGHNVINYCTLPAIVPVLMPKAKFIVVMRNPVTMLYSAFWHSCTRQNGQLTDEEQLSGPDIFHKRVLLRIRAFQACTRDLPLTLCAANSTIFSLVPLPNEPRFNSCGITNIAMGMYYIHIQKWFSVFPREQFLFLRMEDMATQTNATELQVWNFLHLYPHHATLPAKSLNKQQKVDYHSDPQLKMREDTRILLEDFFHPFNTELARLLRDNKFLWS